MIELIAHRAGNAVEAVAPAVVVSDTIEADVHLFHGRVEVRHPKVIRPSRIQWERWWIDLHPPTPPALAEIVAAMPSDTAVWLDLKGFTRRLTIAAVGAVPASRPITTSSRSWWVLAPARSRNIRTMRSVGSRWQLWAVRRVRRWHPTDGIVVNERFLTRGRLPSLLGLTPTVHAWGVLDLPRAVELIEGGITGLIIDDLNLIAQIRRRYPAD